MKDKLQAVIMAAGRSSRFKTNRSKLIEKICGQEMVLFPTKTLEKLKIPTIVVVGYQKEELQKVIRRQHGTKISFVEQTEQKGTGHALMCSQSLWSQEHILIMNADMPLVSTNLLINLWEKHLNNQAVCSFVVTNSLDPALASYGKVITKNNQIKIIEAKDYQALIDQDPAQKINNYFLNAGIYIFKKTFLEQAINQLQTSSVTGEFYITDLIACASSGNHAIEMVEAPVDQIRGINTLAELTLAEDIKQTEIINHWMANGVRFALPKSSYVELNVTIGAGTFIGQGAHLAGTSDIEENCSIEPYVIIDNSIITKNSVIKSFSIIKENLMQTNHFISNMIQAKKQDLT